MGNIICIFIGYSVLNLKKENLIPVKLILPEIIT